MRHAREIQNAPPAAETAADPVRLLAQYDASEVGDAQLCRIFACTAADLKDVRATEEYKEHLAAYTNAQAALEVGLDNRWNSVENEALAGLEDVLPVTTDPRVLLAAAAQANKASRRYSHGRAQDGGPPHSASSRNGRGVINVPEGQEQVSCVVRLRRTFTELLENPQGMTIRSRESSVEIEASFSEADRRIPGSQEVSSLLETALGVRVGKDQRAELFSPDGYVIGEDEIGDLLDDDDK